MADLGLGIINFDICLVYYTIWSEERFFTKDLMTSFPTFKPKQDVLYQAGKMFELLGPVDHNNMNDSQNHIAMTKHTQYLWNKNYRSPPIF